MPPITTDQPLKDKYAIITGASRGLGESIAEAMWQAGASLLLIARSQALLAQLRDRLISYANKEQSLHILTVDLHDPSSPTIIIMKAQEIWPRLDILVNNAAVTGPIGMVADNDWAEWRDSIQVNLLAPVELCKLSIAWMKEVGAGGSILNISGGGATTGRPYFSAYATAKCALVRFSETIAAELGGQGIRVNCIAPGAMNTAMLQEILKAGAEQTGSDEYARAIQITTKQGADPKIAAGVAVYLASEKASGITGKLISAIWDPWSCMHEHLEDLRTTDIYTLRRIVPEDRGRKWTDV